MKAKYSLAVLARRAGVLGSVLLLATALSLRAESPSELLEKGIYSEETKGDLDGAMKLYQQVVEQGKAGEAVAAEAQYRLGVCLYKKKQFGEASAAFEKLLQDFPTQKELVAKAQEYLAGTVVLLPAPWTDGEELQMDLKFATGVRFGVARLRMNAGETNGHKTWQAQSYLHVGVSQISRVVADADSFRPLQSYWKHSLLGTADATYTPTNVTIRLLGKEEPVNVNPNGLVYDNEECIQLIRRLPLATNYSTTVRVLTSLGGGSIIPVKLSVPAVEKVEAPAGAFDCYKVELGLMGTKQTFWYSVDSHRYLVKFEAGGLVAELTSVSQHRPGEAISYQAPTFSVSAPGDWLFFRPDSKSGKAKALLYVMAPNGEGYGEVWVKPLDKLAPAAQESPRAFTDAFLAERADENDLKVRAGSWEGRSVAGQPGASFIADFTEADQKKVAYGVSSFGTSNAVQFVLQVPAGDFETLRPQFETVINSFKWR